MMLDDWRMVRMTRRSWRLVLLVRLLLNDLATLSVRDGWMDLQDSHSRLDGDRHHRHYRAAGQRRWGRARWCSNRTTNWNPRALVAESAAVVAAEAECGPPPSRPSTRGHAPRPLPCRAGSG